MRLNSTVVSLFYKIEDIYFIRANHAIMTNINMKNVRWDKEAGLTRRLLCTEGCAICLSYIHNIDLREVPLYFVYKRKSSGKEHFQGTFHAHQGIEILFIHEGKGTLIIEQKSYELTSNMLCVLQPYQLHNIQVEMSTDSPFVRSIVHYEPSLYENYFEKWPALQSFFHHLRKDKLPSPCIYDLQPTQLLMDLFQSLNARLPYISKNDYYEEFSLFLVTFFQAFKQLWEQHKLISAPYRARKLHQAERILEWLDDHYKEPLRLEQMGRELHVSPHHLSHLFKKSTGSSISEYIAAKRVQKAVLLLTSSEYSIARIGEEVGITNCSHFCKLFKLHIGITPHQYRKEWHKLS
jgi:AraC family transcriptional regulator of arabinose operon